MPIFEFPYSPFQIPPTDPFPKGHTALRPMMIAGIKTPTAIKGFRCVVCLDSGADHCVFPSTFAAALGIDLLTLKKHMTGGVGSSANITYYTDLEIVLGPGLTFKSFAGFTAGLDAQGIGLLGQSGFFDYYNVHFMQKQRTFSIETT